jgi:hypothetical protein
MACILLAKGVVVKGVLLIDSPSPCHHVPMPDELIDYIVNLNGRSACSDTAAMLKTQFRTNSHILASYTPSPNLPPSLAIVLLQSSEGFRHSLLRVPEWLSDRTDLERLRRDWEAVVGSAITTLPIPGNHFQPFDKLHVFLTDYQYGFAHHRRMRPPRKFLICTHHLTRSLKRAAFVCLAFSVSNHHNNV